MMLIRCLAAVILVTIIFTLFHHQLPGEAICASGVLAFLLHKRED